MWTLCISYFFSQYVNWFPYSGSPKEKAIHGSYILFYNLASGLIVLFLLYSICWCNHKPSRFKWKVNSIPLNGDWWDYGIAWGWKCGGYILGNINMPSIVKDHRDLTTLFLSDLWHHVYSFTISMFLWVNFPCVSVLSPQLYCKFFSQRTLLSCIYISHRTLHRALEIVSAQWTSRIKSNRLKIKCDSFHGMQITTVDRLCKGCSCGVGDMIPMSMWSLRNKWGRIYFT